MKKLGFIIGLVVCLGNLTHCSYRMGYANRTLPGNFKNISIPVFKNLTQEVSIEPYFTNALAKQFGISKVANLTNKSLAPAFIRGTILAANFSKALSGLPNLPKNRVLTTQFRLVMQVRIELVRASDKKVIWEEVFSKERTYQGAQIQTASVNSANPLYNQSRKHEYFALIAGDMMAEVHEQITERF